MGSKIKEVCLSHYQELAIEYLTSPAPLWVLLEDEEMKE
jgi:hypothetical protein